VVFAIDRLSFLYACRHCLWIVGNGATLDESGSVWMDIVIDAKKRGCFFDAYEDESLAKAMIGAMEHDHINILLNNDSFLFRKTRWKVRMVKKNSFFC
jgi:senataxin